MTKDEIVSMAKKTLESLAPDEYSDEPYWSASNEELERFAALVAEKEREKCAMLCDDLYRAWGKDMDENLKCPDPIDCADAIRARGQKEYRGARLVLTKDGVIQDGWMGDK